MTSKQIHRDLTVKDILEVLANYELIHQRLPTGMVRGMCVEGENAIYVDNRTNGTERIEVIVHELYHAKHFIRDEPNSERRVKAETKQFMDKFYLNERREI